MSVVGKLFKGIFGGGAAAPKGGPTPLPTPPMLPDIGAAGIFSRATAQARAGAAGTILTGPGGLTEKANTTKKTLTGQ